MILLSMIKRIDQNTLYKLITKTERLERLASLSETEYKGDLEWKKADTIIPSQARHLEIPKLVRGLNHCYQSGIHHIMVTGAPSTFLSENKYLQLRLLSGAFLVFSRRKTCNLSPSSPFLLQEASFVPEPLSDCVFGRTALSNLDTPRLFRGLYR